MLHYKNSADVAATPYSLDQTVLLKSLVRYLTPIFLFSFMVVSGFSQSKKTVGALNISQSQNIIYPVNANAVIDVTKPPYNVDNTGKKDCTNDLNRAYSDVMEVILKAYKKSIIDLAKMSDEEYNKRYHENKRDKVIFPEEMNKGGILYFPNGTYKVSKTIVYAQDLRNVHGMAVQKEGVSAIKEKKIIEYSSDGTFSIFKSRKQQSLNLTIEETPDVPWEQDMKKWVSVNEFGAKGDGMSDDTKAIQKAMNSGKPVIYFNQGSYLIDAPITVPATVKRINFMNANLKSGSTLNKMIDKGAFVINENASDPLIMEDLLAWEEFRGDHY